MFLREPRDGTTLLQVSIAALHTGNDTDSACTIKVILAVSTTAPNPLQAITALHSRALELPYWVDPTILRYTLIIHPQDSSLSDEEYVMEST